MKYLTLKEVIELGTEYTDDIYYSGDYYDQLYSDDENNNEKPIEGLLYERYSDGSLANYGYYTDGVENGQQVKFYNSGKIKSDCIMDMGMIHGEYNEWFENGNIKSCRTYVYGFLVKMKEYDNDGNVIKEKNKLTSKEKLFRDKLIEMYEDK